MATGMYVRRQAEDNFRRQYPGPLSFVATEWLANVENDENIVIQHARNKGEYRVGVRRIPVDGYCRDFLANFPNIYFHIHRKSNVLRVFTTSCTNNFRFSVTRTQFTSSTGVGE